MQIELGRVSRLIGGVVIGLVVLGMIINSKDIRRYIRMSTM